MDEKNSFVIEEVLFLFCVFINIIFESCIIVCLFFYLPHVCCESYHIDNLRFAICIIALLVLLIVNMVLIYLFGKKLVKAKNKSKKAVEDAKIFKDIYIGSKSKSDNNDERKSK